MPYATTAELQSPAFGIPAAAFDRLAETPEEIDAILDQALASASSVADGYLAARFTLPLAVWGDDLKRAVCAIACYDLMVGIGFNPEGADEQLRKRYEDAMAWLKGIATGVVVPVVTDSSATPDSSASIWSGAKVTTNTKRGW
jgi:phage gp36-like protein